MHCTTVEVRSNSRNDKYWSLLGNGGEQPNATVLASGLTRNNAKVFSNGLSMEREHVILRMPRQSHRLVNPDALSSTRKFPISVLPIASHVFWKDIQGKSLQSLIDH